MLHISLKLSSKTVGILCRLLLWKFRKSLDFPQNYFVTLKKNRNFVQIFVNSCVSVHKVTLLSKFPALGFPDIPWGLIHS